MDLGIESVEENEVSQDGNENKTRFDEKLGLGFDGNFGSNTLKSEQKGTTVVKLGSEEGVNSKVTPTKGAGLKKWKRIRRNVVRDPNLSAEDMSKVLKRGLSGTGNANLSRNPRDIKEKNDGSSNMNAFGNVVFSNVIRSSSSDSRYAVGSGFVVGADSENSEDRSSKSSTAASEPKLRHERSRSKNMNSKNFSNLAQRVQQGNRQIESSKKPAGGGRVKIEKENSVSSMESDSRSSNFKQGVFTVTSNGKHADNANVYDGGNSVEAHFNEHFIDGDEAGYGNENIGEDEDLLPRNLAGNLSWDVPEDTSLNNQSTTTEDPLTESIRSLQAVQKALEEEVQKFREIGIEVVSPDDESAKCSNASDIATVDLALQNSSLSGYSGAEEIKQATSSSLEFQVLSLTQNVNILESKLDELQGILVLKDSRIVELETALSSSKSPNEESASTMGLSEEKHKEMEYELEELFRQKIEAEVEYLAITKVMQNFGAGLQRTLLEEQEKLSENQEQVLNKLAYTQSKASVLKDRAEELEKYYGDSLEVEESFVLQKRVCKVTFYLFLQLILLILCFWFLVSQLSLNSGGVVPT